MGKTKGRREGRGEATLRCPFLHHNGSPTPSSAMRQNRYYINIGIDPELPRSSPTRRLEGPCRLAQSYARTVMTSYIGAETPSTAAQLVGTSCGSDAAYLSRLSKAALCNNELVFVQPWGLDAPPRQHMHEVTLWSPYPLSHYLLFHNIFIVSCPCCELSGLFFWCRTINSQ